MMLYSAFLLGLISSLHCIGMCGPIALMLPVDRDNSWKKVLQVLTYHAGRISTYVSIGLIFGLLGRAFYMARFQQYLSIIAGVAIIAIAILPERTLARYNFSKSVFKVVSKIRSALGKRFKSQSFSSLFLIGSLNGLLPCGMVYAAIFGALAMPEIGTGMLYMALFGLGTVPLMSSVVYVQKFISMAVRNRIRHAIPYAMVCIGVLFLLRGMALDIPYISPSDTNLFVQAVPNCH